MGECPSLSGPQAGDPALCLLWVRHAGSDQAWSSLLGAAAGHEVRSRLKTDVSVLEPESQKGVQSSKTHVGCLLKGNSSFCARLCPSSPAP